MPFVSCTAMVRAAARRLGYEKRQATRAILGIDAAPAESRLLGRVEVVPVLDLTRPGLANELTLVTCESMTPLQRETHRVKSAAPFVTPGRPRC